MTKYKIGDKVRVRNGLLVGKIYKMENIHFSDIFVEGMKEHIGQTLTIYNIENGYEVEENEWTWTDEMLEDVYKENCCPICHSENLISIEALGFNACTIKIRVRKKDNTIPISSKLCLECGNIYVNQKQLDFINNEITN